MTGYATVDTAVEAIKLGAMDYLSKPLDFARLEQLLVAVREDIERRRSLLAMESDVARQLEFCGMIGRGAADAGTVRDRSADWRRTCAPRSSLARPGRARNWSPARCTRPGPRRERRFVTVNCSAVVETLFESELFGHMRGAFTGATDHKPGLFELADGGTLFLDEIGELPLVGAGKAAARPRARRGAPRRLARVKAGGRARHRRHQPRPARGGGGGPLPERLVLPPQHRRGHGCRRCANVARTSRT